MKLLLKTTLLCSTIAIGFIGGAAFALSGKKQKNNQNNSDNFNQKYTITEYIDFQIDSINNEINKLYTKAEFVDELDNRIAQEASKILTINSIKISLKIKQLSNTNEVQKMFNSDGNRYAYCGIFGIDLWNSFYKKLPIDVKNDEQSINTLRNICSQMESELKQSRETLARQYTKIYPILDISDVPQKYRYLFDQVYNCPEYSNYSELVTKFPYIYKNVYYSIQAIDTNQSNIQNIYQAPDCSTSKFSIEFSHDNKKIKITKIAPDGTITKTDFFDAYITPTICANGPFIQTSNITLGPNGYVAEIQGISKPIWESKTGCLDINIDWEKLEQLKPQIEKLTDKLHKLETAKALQQAKIKNIGD